MDDINSFSERQSTRSQYSRSSKYRRRKNRQRAVICSLIIIVFVVVAIILCIWFSHSFALKQVQGTWVYDQYTQYEFDGKGNGCMCLEEYHYEYTYKIQNNELSLNFKDDSVHDCTYAFTVSDDKLTIVGGEGTTGGTYELTKQ